MSLTPDPVEHGWLFRELQAMYDSCAGETGCLVVIRGPVGTGKTEVLRALIADVRERGGEVFSAGGSESERNLPLGVVEQLFDRPGLPPEVIARRAALLDGQQPPWRTYLSRQSDPVGTVVDDLCESLLSMAASLPLLVAVDDAHLADQPSLRCLHRLAERLPRAGFCLVVVRTLAPGPAHAADRLVEPSSGVALLPSGVASPPGGVAEPLSRAGGALDDGAEALGAPLPDEVVVHHLVVEPLSLGGVTALLRSREGEVAAGAAEVHHAVTGGNLSLLHALLEGRRAVGAGLADVVVSTTFAEAVTSCLFRCDPVSRQVARAAAVLREPVRAGEIARLLELDERLVGRALDLLAQSGLLDGGRFRHPIGRSATVASMAQHERAELFQRVDHLHAADEPSAEIAEQLVEAGRRSGDWMPDVLRRAAEQALAEGDLERARAHLRTASTVRMDDTQRAGFAATQASLRWRTNPGEVLQYLPALLADVRVGRLVGPDAVTTLLYLLWHGQLDEALDILPQVVTVSADDPPVLELLRPALASLAFMYPGSTERRTGAGAIEAPDDLVAAAREVLRDRPPAGDTFGVTFAALYLSAFAVGPDGWHDPWEPELPASDLPIWQALIEAVRAELALRRGDLPAATGHARAGLTALGSDGWGVAVGWPISVLVSAASDAGDHGAAAGYLAMPVPAGMFATPFGLRYLLARGRHHFATDRVHAALNDFYACSETATAWHLDLPELLPWRTELARAYVKLDRLRPSQELARQQLSGLTDRQDRLRGVALRVLAGTLDPEARIAVLRRAIEVLERSGDRLEAAHALADLGATYQRLGLADLAGTALRAAEQQAQACGAVPVDGSKNRQMPAGATGDGADGALLTDAERRVAALAAKGYTNREIAQRLFLTVSTVEQHLTRVYRKLHVVRRRELPAWLRVGAFDDPDFT